MNNVQSLSGVSYSIKKLSWLLALVALSVPLAAHSEAEDDLAGFADRRVVICHLAQSRAEVVHRGNNGREGRNKIEFSCQQRQPNEHEAEHVDSEKAPNGTDDLGLNTAGIQFERNDGVGVQQLP